MKPAAFAYARPESVEEAVSILAEHGDDAKVLAGGQSLMPLLSMRFARPSVLVDVNRVPELAALADGPDELGVGACVRQADFGSSPLVLERVPLAHEAIPWIGHFVTRNRGTVGGSIAHADARAELPLVLVALDGTVLARSSRGSREIPAGELFATHFSTTLEPDELLVETRWPRARPGWGFAFEEFAQRHGDFALAMVAVALERNGDAIAGAHVAVGAASDRPQRVPEAEAALVGRSAPAAAEEASQLAAAAFDPPDDLHASGAYRAHLTRELTARAVERAWTDAARRSHAGNAPGTGTAP